MPRKFVTVHGGAWITMDLLPASKRKSIYAAFKPLRTLPPEQWPKAGVDLLKPEEGLFCLLVPPNLNVFFTAPEPGQFVIQGIIPQETVDLVASQERGTKT